MTLPPHPLARAGRPYFPAPPLINYVQGVAPGVPADAMGNAAYVPESHTVYSQGKPDRYSRAHEAGHAFDSEVLNPGQRVLFQRLMGLPAGPWSTGTGLQGLRSPSEWFADYYSAAANHVNPRLENTAAYATITPKRLKRFENALVRLGRQQRLAAY
jgi:hypothetical protein